MHDMTSIRRAITIIVGASMVIGTIASCGGTSTDSASVSESRQAETAEAGCPLVSTETVSEATGVEWQLLEGFPFINAYNRKECTFTLASDQRSAEEVVRDLGGESLAVIVERKDVGGPCTWLAPNDEVQSVHVDDLAFDISIPIEAAGLARLDGLPRGAFACTEDLVVSISDTDGVLTSEDHLGLLTAVIETGTFVELMARNDPLRGSSLEIVGQIQGTILIESVECTDLGNGGLYLIADGRMGDQIVTLSGSDEVNDDGTVGKVLGQIGETLFGRSSDTTFAASTDGLRFDNSEMNILTGDDILEGTSSGSLFFTGEVLCP